MTEPTKCLILVKDSGHDYYYRFDPDNVANLVRIVRADHQGTRREEAVEDMLADISKRCGGS